jgi:hypothetical protein
MNNFLLPYRFKWIGVVMVFIGLAGLVFYLFFDFRLMAPVFAVISSFFDTKIFTTFRTNIADELIMLSFLTGFFFLSFSKEKIESEILDQLRIKAFSKAILANTGLLIFSILFTYGNGFLAILLLNLFSLFIFYLIFLYFLKRRQRKKSS